MGLLSELICLLCLEVLGFFSSTLCLIMVSSVFPCLLYGLCFVWFYFFLFFQIRIYMISSWLHFNVSKMLFNLNSLCIKVKNKIINSDFFLCKKSNFTLLHFSACCFPKFMFYLWHIHSCQLSIIKPYFNTKVLSSRRHIWNWHSVAFSCFTTL